MQATTTTYLESCLAPLADYLAQSDVTDIYINRPAEVWIETLGRDPVPHEAPELTTIALARLARQIAAVSAQGISRKHPLLAASLPTGERVQVVMPPATRGDIIFAIRKHVVTTLSLADQERSGAFTDIDLPDRFIRLESPLNATDRDPVAFLRSAIRFRWNILISGGTSSGKTTFLNTLLYEIPRNERLVTIEDTPELRVMHRNAVGLLAVRGMLGEAEITADDLLITALRMRPDRIILGELRGTEAATYLRAINTGHPGSISTIHADSPERAIDQLGLLIMQTGTRMAWEDVVRYLHRSIDVIVQLERKEGNRRITSILEMRSHPHRMG